MAKTSHIFIYRYFYAASVGMDPTNMADSMAPIFMNHVPDATNAKTMVHMAQMYRNGNKFYKYDFGDQLNQMLYGSKTPPEYSLQNVKTPIALFSGDADGFATQKDIQILMDHLPNVFLHHKVNVEGFAHLDFIFGSNASKYLNEEILAVINYVKF